MRIIFTFFLSFFIFAQFCSGQTAKSNDLYNPLSNNLAFTFEGGVTLGQTDYKDLRLSYLTKGSVEYYFFSRCASLFSIKGIGGIGIVSGEDNGRVPNIFNTTLYYLGAGLGYTYSINDKVYPYFTLGISNMWFYPQDKNGNKLPHTSDRQMGAYNGELGVKFMISQTFSFNVSGNIILATKDYLDNIKSGMHNDAAYDVTVGFTYFFGRGKDSDQDKIPDYMDRCPGTAPYVKVDETGCPLDSDGDGVPDYLDKCSNTPKGLTVDANGCPLDADNDGVPDYLDQCPNTPAGVKVDSNGCPLDSDGDGVPNYLDKCPNTPKGIQVDSAGCPIKQIIYKEQEGINLKGDANFESGKSELLPGAFEILDSLAVRIKLKPNSKWLVEGYTDAIGSDAVNLKLSRARAEAVVNYLVSKGVNRNSLIIKAFGKANPISNNNTAVGRAINRRVEIKLVK